MNKKIKIAFIIDRLDIGGTEKQLLETIRRLDKSKFSLDLICLRPSRYFIEMNIEARKRVLGVYSLMSPAGFMNFMKFIVFLKKERVDIVQTFFFDSTVFGVLSAKMARVKKVVVTRRDLGFWYTPRLLSALRFINLFVDRFLVNSKAVKANVAKLEKVPPQKIDVIFNGIEEPPDLSEDLLSNLKTQLCISAFDRVIGMVANLNRPVKRVDLFIRAAAFVSQKMQNVKFVIVGDGHLRKELEALSKGLGVEDKVIFIGKKKDVWPYIMLFDVGVLCSDSEGFSNSLLEYMVSGIPVVATDTGGNKEIVANAVNGYLVPVGDYFALAERIIKIISNEALRSKMINASFEKAKDFLWHTVMNKIEDYYLSLSCEAK